MNDTKKEAAKESVWCVCADIISNADGLENERDASPFCAGEKIYIIDWFPGMGESIIAIGQHRKSHEYMKTIINIKLAANPSLRLVDNPSVVMLLREHEAEAGFATDKKFMECILEVVSEWQEDGVWE